MAALNFVPIMRAILAPDIEGGFSDDPRDAGGMTNHGVTARMWAIWRHLPLSAITQAMMQELTIEDVLPFYKFQYWNLVDGDALPGGIDCMTVHFEINAGPRAAPMLQSIVGSRPDGVIGRDTLSAIETYIGIYGVARLIEAQAQAQLEYYGKLPAWNIFGNGWMRRVATMKALALTLVNT